MARNRDPFSLALLTLRQLASDGVFAPDRPIVILDEARRLRLSTTPIREALAWLGGEGMIERAPNGGYMGLRQDVSSVIGRYRLRFRLLSAALSDDDEPVAIRAAAESKPLRDVFATIVRLQGDDVLWRAYERVARQLAWLEDAEAMAIPDLGKEAEALHAAMSGDRSALISALSGFHRRLTSATPAILIAAHRPGPYPDVGDPS